MTQMLNQSYILSVLIYFSMFRKKTHDIMKHSKNLFLYSVPTLRYVCESRQCSRGQPYHQPVLSIIWNITMLPMTVTGQKSADFTSESLACCYIVLFCQLQRDQHISPQKIRIANNTHQMTYDKIEAYYLNTPSQNCLTPEYMSSWGQI